MSKLFWVSLPLLLAGGVVAWLAWRGRLPSRPVLNVVFSLLLLGYVLVTAGLGIFWVANQHLPVFDWHYLFGYTMVVVLVVHLAFNLRVVASVLRRGRTGRAAMVPPAGRRPVIGAFGVLGVLLAAGGGYLLGLRHGRTELRIDLAGRSPASGDAAASWAVVEQFHDFSAHTRDGVLRRAPGADWGDPPPPFKSVSGGQRQPLPPPRPVAATGGDLQVLSDLLWHTVGVSLQRGGIHFRTSPSSGALFSTELYVLAHALDGAPAGVWHHDVPAAALVRTGRGVADPAALGMAPWPDGSVAALVATAVFQRSGHKYRDRTYRYVLCDLGHALENLRLAATACGWQATLLPAFDEARLAAALGVDQAVEGVLAVVLLQRAGAPLPAVAAARAWSPAALAGDGAGARLGITDAIHRATSLQASAPAPWSSPQPPRTTATPAQPLVPLPSAPAARRDPLPLIARRRSVRRYARRPLPQADLAALLAAMSDTAPLLSGAIRIDLVAHAVAGVEPGAWRYHAAGHGLERRAAAEPAEQRSRSRAAALGQDVIGDAAVVFVLSADRAPLMADPAGAARGYRHAFIEAGLVGERLYLEATARGLGVCAVGAFYDDEAAALVGVDPGREWVLHFAALGPLDG